MIETKSLEKFARGKVQVDERTNFCVIYTRVSTKEQADNNLSLETGYFTQTDPSRSLYTDPSFPTPFLA